MFLESDLSHSNKVGSIEVICGSMFSGKTEELLRRLKRSNFAKLKIETFKPATDTRYDNINVVSHDDNFIKSTIVKNSHEILELIQKPDVVAIDEAQFFNDDLSITCNKLANLGIRVIVAGLDMDFKGNPFGYMPKLLSISDHITKVHAICVDCGNIANYSFRTSNNPELVSLGEKNNYKALCRGCFNKHLKNV